jgi:hypothetical protein
MPSKASTPPEACQKGFEHASLQHSWCEGEVAQAGAPEAQRQTSTMLIYEQAGHCIVSTSEMLQVLSLPLS